MGDDLLFIMLLLLLDKGLELFKFDVTSVDLGPTTLAKDTNCFKILEHVF